MHKVARDELGEIVSDNEDDDRCCVSGLRSLALQPRQCSDMIRCRRAHDSQCHHTCDTVFEEDDQPSITSDPQAAVVAPVPRRIARNLMAFGSSTGRQGRSVAAGPLADRTWSLGLSPGPCQSARATFTNPICAEE